MRDPELVFKAQLAASALERAWQRWRVVHGLVADPMPTISSYVGYSLEEPWGQPRVVFGLSADDAEQLAALLDRHDCVGPVHAMIASQPGGRELAAGRVAVRRLPVPTQAPAALAGRSVSPDRPTERVGDRDGPVFRQVAAAARQSATAPRPRETDAADGPAETAATDHGGDATAAGRESAGKREAETGPRLAVTEQAVAGQAADGAVAGHEAGGRPAAAADDEPVGRPAAAADGAGHEGASALDGVSAPDVTALDAGLPPDAAAQRDAASPAGPASADGSTDEGLTETGGSTDEGGSKDAGLTDAGGWADAGLTDAGGWADAGSTDEGLTDAGGSADAASAPNAAGHSIPAGRGRAGRRAARHAANQPVDEPADGPGPLALAASAARVEAESRIRAALHQARWSAPEPPVPGEGADAGGPEWARPPASGDGSGSVGQVTPDEDQGLPATARPEVASGAQPWPSDDLLAAPDPSLSSDLAWAWGGPVSGSTDAAGVGQMESGPAPFQPSAELGAYLDAGPEPDPSFDEPLDHAPSGFTRRNRITRGYSIPRLSRPKRPGAIPGAQQSG